MLKPFKLFILTYSMLLSFSSILMAQNDNGWKSTTVTKTIENFTFTFPIDGYAFDNREVYVKQFLDAIKPNCQLIGLTEFNDKINIKFYRSKQEMNKETPYKYSGVCDSYYKTLYLVANDGDSSIAPPIKHELMHMIAMLNWGENATSSQWMNEGLASYAQNNCNGLKNGQVYRYLLESNKLINIDSLTSNFYKQDEMIAYHQSAYMVECLLTKYGIEKFKSLWLNGFIKFNEIYGIPFSQFETDVQKELRKKLPKVEQIDWKTFMVKCK